MPVPTITSVWIAGLAGHLLFSQISHLPILTVGSRVLYNILSFWQPFLQMLSMDSDGHSRTLVLNSVSLWGLVGSGSQATELRRTRLQVTCQVMFDKSGFHKTQHFCHVSLMFRQIKRVLISQEKRKPEAHILHCHNSECRHVPKPCHVFLLFKRT